MSSQASSLSEGPPNPNLSRSSSSTSDSLSQVINAAIAPVHTKINSLILKRMPLAVPPRSTDPSTYVTGLLHFGAAYIAFESLWQNMLRPTEPGAEPTTPYIYPFTYPGGSVNDEPPPPLADRTRHILERLYWPTLLRSARIKADISAMTGWTEEVVEEQMRAVGKTGRLGRFLFHTKRSINKKPHLILAYAYCLYLALLSGGYYIRNELALIKTEFWQIVPAPIKPGMLACNKGPVKDGPPETYPTPASPTKTQRQHDPRIKVPLDFLDFDLDDSPPAEDRRQQVKSLKADFKQRFAESEQALNDVERDEIAKESICIFQNLILVVAQLDEICGTPPDKGTIAHLSEPPPGNIASRMRDSIAIAKGRFLHKSKGRKSRSGSVPPVPVEGSWDTSTTSRVSLLSTTGDEDSDGHHLGYNLGEHATVPTSGFRSVSYGKKQPPPVSEEFDLKKRRVFSGDGSEEDRDVAPEIPPASRAAVKTTVREKPDYAIYAFVSNTVLLLVIAVMLVGYFYMQHG